MPVLTSLTRNKELLCKDSIFFPNHPIFSDFFILYHTQLKTPEEVECADSSVPYPVMLFRVCHPLPLFWPLLMSGACHQFRPRRVVFYGCFQYKRSFLSQCWCKGTIFLSRKQEYGKKVRKKSVSIWFIAIYIKLNFAFNIFGKTKVSLRVGVIKGH